MWQPEHSFFASGELQAAQDMLRGGLGERESFAAAGGAVY
jgi:hypothetical protein